MLGKNTNGAWLSAATLLCWLCPLLPVMGVAKASQCSRPFKSLLLTAGEIGVDDVLHAQILNEVGRSAFKPEEERQRNVLVLCTGSLLFYSTPA